MTMRHLGLMSLLGLPLLLAVSCQGNEKDKTHSNIEKGKGVVTDLASRLKAGAPAEVASEGVFATDSLNDVIGIGGGRSSPHSLRASRPVADARQSGGIPPVRFDGDDGGEAPAKADKVGAGKPSSKKQSKQAWKRSKGRPSFARVYVGGGNSLRLERMRVTIYLDGPRARTVVDHIFKNPHDKALEGTFEYPLPAGATPSAYAMFVSDRQDAAPDFFARRPGNDKGSESPPAFLANMAFEEGVRRVREEDWGKLRQARVVRKKRARQVYEEITRRRIDPALLEYAGGNTFRGRVFPIPAKGYNRVILAYEETLPVGEEGLRYRFPLPDCDLGLLHITVSTPVHGVRKIVMEPAAGNAGQVVGGRRLQQLAWEKEKGPGGDLRIRIVPESSESLCLSGPDQSRPQGQAFLASLHPNLPKAKVGKGTSRAVFLLDTSLSENPDRFAVNRKLVQRILERDDAIKSFNVLLFDVTARWLQPGGFIDNTKQARGEAFASIDRILLEGATDLSAALRKLAVIPWIPDAGTIDKTPLDVFLLTDGQITWGERKLSQILAPVG